MEYLTLLGESAYTASIAQKIKDLINKTGAAKVDDVSAVYVHYAHLKQTARDEARVSHHVPYNELRSYEYTHYYWIITRPVLFA